MDTKKAFKCDGCETVHFDVSDANDCCGATEGYACGECETFYESEEYADICCV